MRTVLVVVVLAAVLAGQVQADTVYPPGSNPLIHRRWCVHLESGVAATRGGPGERSNDLFVGAGLSVARLGGLRLPVVSLAMGEDNQFLGSIGASLRIGEWDNGQFEPQLIAAYVRDFTNVRGGVTVGLAIGF